MENRFLIPSVILAVCLVGLCTSAESVPVQDIFFTDSTNDSKNDIVDGYDINQEDKERFENLIKILEDMYVIHDEYVKNQDTKRSHNKNQFRRHQASKWDIGFGKRSSDWTGKSFLQSLFDSSKMKKFENFNRKQHWDVTYGKK